MSGADTMPLPLSARAPAAVEPPARALADILSSADILVGAYAERKHDALGLVADLLARRTNVGPEAAFAALLRRERLGYTCIGDGIAMPHGRIQGAPRPAAAILRLRKPVDYETIDDDAVDLLVGVSWPDADPLGFVPMLSSIWRQLRVPSTAKAIRLATSPEDLHAVVSAGGLQ